MGLGMTGGRLLLDETPNTNTTLIFENEQPNPDPTSMASRGFTQQQRLFSSLIASSGVANQESNSITHQKDQSSIADNVGGSQPSYQQLSPRLRKNLLVSLPPNCN